MNQAISCYYSSQNIICEQQNKGNENPQNQASQKFQGENQYGPNDNLQTNLRSQAQEELQEADIGDNNPNRKSCRCRKTQCLKKYCECFSGGLICGTDCQCTVECLNTQNGLKRSQTIQLMKKRNPQAFKQKIEGHQHSRGCNCKKTGCKKKYCQCLQAGLICGDQCKCQKCQNMDEPEYNQKLTRTVKKQSRMMQMQME